MVKIIKPLIFNVAHSEILLHLSLKEQDYKELASLINKTPQTIFRHIQYLRKNKWMNKNKVNFDKLTDEFIKYCREDVILTNTLKVSEQEMEVAKSIIKYSLRRCVELGYYKKKGFTIAHLFNILKIKMFIDDDLREVPPVFSDVKKGRF